MATLEDGVRDRGPHETYWDGRDGRGRPVAAGVYYCAARAAGETRRETVVLVR